MLGVGLGLTARVGQQTASAGPGPGTTLVFAMLGQSNMIGRAPFDSGSVHPEGVQQWGRTGGADGTLIPATVPLDHVGAVPGDMGLDISFSEAIQAAIPQANIVFVPSAEGGTGFQTGHWGASGVRYLDAVARVNAAMIALPGAHFAGFLWHQGESDAGNPTYQADLDAMIAGLRQDISAAGPETPFVLGGLALGFVGSDPERQAIQTVLESTPVRVSHTGFASSDSLTAGGSDVHFAAADLRTLGGRYAAAWLDTAAPRVTVPIPAQTDVSTGSSLSTPSIAAPIPDQTDPQGIAGPQALATIPDQEDTLP